LPFGNKTIPNYPGGVVWWYRPGLPDFSWSKIPKRGKIYQITTKYTKWPQNISNGRKIDQTVIKYTKIFHNKTLQNLPRMGFFV
jgi:hypothetical protein